MTSYTCEAHPHSIRLSIDDFRHTYHFVDFDNYLKTNDTRVTATRMGTILDSCVSDNSLQAWQLESFRPYEFPLINFAQAATPYCWWPIWDDLVPIYCSKEFTYEGDRLAGLSGVVSRFARKTRRSIYCRAVAQSSAFQPLLVRCTIWP
jgi:hypothetical protein